MKKTKSTKSVRSANTQKTTKVRSRTKSTGVPLGVKVISVLYYLAAVFFVVSGLAFFVGAGMVETLAIEYPFIAMLGSSLFVLGGILFIALAVLTFFVGRGLWKVKPWARMTAIVIAILMIIMAIVEIFQGQVDALLSFAIQLIIAGYLLFNKEVKRIFR